MSSYIMCMYLQIHKHNVHVLTSIQYTNLSAYKNVLNLSAKDNVIKPVCTQNILKYIRTQNILKPICTQICTQIYLHKIM